MEWRERYNIQGAEREIPRCIGENIEILGSLRGPTKPYDAKVIMEKEQHTSNVSNESKRPLKAGQETLMINSSVFKARERNGNKLFVG